MKAVDEKLLHCVDTINLLILQYIMWRREDNQPISYNTQMGKKFIFFNFYSFTITFLCINKLRKSFHLHENSK